MMRMLRAFTARTARVVALLPAVPFLVLAGCRQQPSFADLLDGDAAATEEIQAVLALLAQSGTEPGALPLYPEGGAAGPRGVRVADGSIVALGVAGITDLSPLAELSRLQSLAVAGSFASLDGMGEHPELLRLRIASPERHLHSLRGLRAPGLEELEVRFANLADDPALPFLPDLRALRLIDVGLRRVPALDLPQLERLELRDNDIGTIAGMRALPVLRILDLQGNDLTSVDGLPAMAALEALDLEGNPVLDLDALRDPGFESLRKVDVRGLPVSVVQGSSFLAERGIEVVRDPPPEASSDEERETLERLRAVRAGLPGTFVESLPDEGGRARRGDGSCRWSAGSFRAPRLHCDRTLGTLEGLLRLDLVKIDPALPGYGGDTAIRVRATLAVERGTARIYLREKIDLREAARTITRLTGEAAAPRRRDAELPEGAPGDAYDGYRYGEARPGEPVTISGEASYLGSRVVVWLEAVDGSAEGVRLALEPQ